MSDWTHRICLACWNKMNPDRPSDPEKSYDDGAEQTCCFCGLWNRSGIYVRKDPQNMGNHCQHDRAMDGPELVSRLVDRGLLRYVETPYGPRLFFEGSLKDEE